MRFSLLSALTISASFLGCRNESPTQAEVRPAIDVKPADSDMHPAAIAPSASASAPSPVVLAPSASASANSHGPAPIAAADVERAKRYVNGLSRGRRATAAKKYASAIGYFDQALEAEPGDARALSERGYAHLLAEELDAAAKDLEAAAKRAASADLVRQILFNQATIADKRGDTKAAAALRAQRDELGGAKRSKSKDCSVSTSRSGKTPVVVQSFRDAWNEIKASHFRFFGNPPEPLDAPAIDDKADEDTIRNILTGNAPAGDGGWAIQTDGSQLQVGHVIFVRGKQIYVLGGLGGFQMGRCPFGDGVPSVTDGDVPRIYIEQENVEMGYMCGVPKSNEIRPCEEVSDGTPIQSYCYWTGSKFRTFFVDPKTLAISLTIEESVEAHGSSTFQSARPRAVITMQQDAVLVTGCGVESRETIP